MKTPSAALDGGDGSDYIHRVDLRSSASARRTGQSGPSSDAAAIAAAKKKNDRIDARKIAD
jgi:hypothetical protein